MKVALPDDLRAQLDDASEKNRRSIAEEIRIRLQTSFERDVDVDKPTRDFLEGVARVPVEIAREVAAAWDKHAGSHEAFEEAILKRLGRLKPEGSTAFGHRPRRTIPSENPRLIGALIEARLWEQPDFTSSPMRRLMEEEFQRMGSPHALLYSPQKQRKPDRPTKKSGK